MSERKTSEIKLRVTPSFKAAVQLAAEQAGETMSVYIESASQDRMKSEFGAGIAEARKALDAGSEAVVDYLIEGSVISEMQQEISAEINALGFLSGVSTSLNPPVAQNPVPASRNDNPEQWVSGGHEKFEVPCAKNCHPWEWCECKQLRRD